MTSKNSRAGPPLRSAWAILRSLQGIAKAQTDTFDVAFVRYFRPA